MLLGMIFRLYSEIFVEIQALFLEILRFEFVTLFVKHPVGTFNFNYAYITFYHMIVFRYILPKTKKKQIKPNIWDGYWVIVGSMIFLIIYCTRQSLCLIILRLSLLVRTIPTSLL